MMQYVRSPVLMTLTCCRPDAQMTAFNAVRFRDPPKQGLVLNRTWS